MDELFSLLDSETEI